MSDLIDFWQDQHSRNTSWLTGTTFGMILRQYDLQVDTFKNRCCLEIGVGRGSVTKPLSELAETVYCADISQTALDRVRSWVKDTKLTQDISQIPPVDVALCHLVLVHCNNAECQRILESINLNKQGSIFCQFSCFMDPGIGINDAVPEVQKMLEVGVKHFFRDISEIESIIESAGLKVRKTWRRYPGDFFGWTGQYWQYYELYR